MVTYSITYGGQERNYTGLSSDEKPVEGVANGSTFYEMDTGKVFMLDADGRTWMEQ